ncbi:hypothetical protein DSO57_1019249 [Entomophthora muscae]|uniref:Uncharacterized protein n=1 Tax=Entomophthora muscae TaxID=34485 RepID=A0ACC2UEU3_9FUNG|nr:hypothetical protein DSO57_1019249 [Entomophthora muscae]
MLEIPPTPLPTMPHSQDFSKLGFIYITVLGLANQVVPHTGSWRSLATAVNYLARIVLIVYLAFQARPTSPMGAQQALVWAMTVYQEYHAAPSGEGEAGAGMGMVHQIMGPNFTR